MESAANVLVICYAACVRLTTPRNIKMNPHPHARTEYGLLCTTNKRTWLENTVHYPDFTDAYFRQGSCVHIVRIFGIYVSADVSVVSLCQTVTATKAVRTFKKNLSKVKFVCALEAEGIHRRPTFRHLYLIFTLSKPYFEEVIIHWTVFGVL